MFYFAYGSNMADYRIKNRCASAVYICPAVLHKYAFNFGKLGADNTGKASIRYTGDARDKVYGVIYNISSSDVSRLDLFEGVQTGHYIRKVVDVKAVYGGYMKTHVYQARTHFDDIMPAMDYLRYIVDGCNQSRLPRDYKLMILQKARNAKKIQTGKKVLAKTI